MTRRKASFIASLLAFGFLALASFASQAGTVCPLLPQQHGHASNGSKNNTALNPCEPGGGGGGGGTTTPPLPPSVMTIGDHCSLPGPYADDRCTVLFQVHDNPANYIICLWHGNSLVSCEGRVFWGGGFDWVGAAGADVEFRHHTGWPTQDPDWPNAQLVRTKGQLLKSQHITAQRRVAPGGACNVVVQPGSSIQGAINTGVATICLAPGVHPVSTTIYPHANQTLRSSDPSQPAKIQPAAGINVIDVEVANVTISDLVIDASATARPVWGILVYKGSNVLMERVKIYRVLYSLGVTEGASNVEFRDSEIANGGDGLACSGCAHPSIWINNSSDVRVIKSTLSNNGVGPEGDGELACYNSPNVVIQNSTVANSGASGMYLVNCDRAVVIGNLITGAKEWGLDIVDTNQPSGTDLGLFQWNRIEYSRNGGAVLKNSVYDTFSNNTWTYNRQGPGASGSCNGVNLRNITAGFFQFNDVATPWPVYCND